MREISQFIGFYDDVGKSFVILLLTRTKMNSLRMHILALKMAPTKLVGKTFVVCRKSRKAVKSSPA